LLIEGEQEERDGLSGDSGVQLRNMGWKPMLHATCPVCPSSSTNSGIRKVDAEKYNHASSPGTNQEQAGYTPGELVAL
jgi:hypothetical protein